MGLRKVDIICWTGSQVVSLEINNTYTLFAAVTHLCAHTNVVQLFQKHEQSKNSVWCFTDLNMKLKDDPHQLAALPLFDTISQY